MNTIQTSLVFSSIFVVLTQMCVYVMTFCTVTKIKSFE